jgi:hypothetical protein
MRSGTIPILTCTLALLTTAPAAGVRLPVSSRDDARAEDLTGEGLAEQLGAVATVLGQADASLTRIAALVGAAPSPSAVEAADAVWAEAAAVFNRTADLLANTNHTPPSPVCPAG